MTSRHTIPVCRDCRRQGLNGNMGRCGRCYQKRRRQAGKVARHGLVLLEVAADTMATAERQKRVAEYTERARLRLPLEG